MPSVVLDTVIFVRALINPNGRWGRLVFDHYPRYTLVISQPLVLELLDVLHRPKLARKYGILPGLDIACVLTLVSQAQLVDMGEVPSVSRDPNDDKFLATAVAGGADYLVSEDEDLLVLGSHEGVRIVDALTFLRILDEAAGQP
jgi:putative PIN family toxin of toxin-antitoxin system